LNMNSVLIALEGIELKAPIGYYDEERKNQNDFIIDLEVGIEFVEKEDHDDIHNTLNYERLHTIILEEMRPACRLMEDPAYRILEQVKRLSDEIRSVKLDIRKKNPPLNSKIQHSRVSIHWMK
jgi:dihydroneopterin aldolase